MGTATLLWGMIFGAIGAGYCLYARQQRAPVPLVCGLALMLFPYFVSNVWLMMLVGAVLMLVPRFVSL